VHGLAAVNPGELQELRRVVAAVERLRGREVREVTVRSDLRHLKVELTGGLILVIAVEADDQGRPHLSVDVVDTTPETGSRQQIEVHFD
jgi:hypothetical protein